jgi:hypothetical protein
MTDVKETKEVLVAAIKLIKTGSELAKDGIDLSDAVALGSKFISDEEFRTALVEGVKGRRQDYRRDQGYGRFGSRTTFEGRSR